ncbi:hypothetical protein ABBQ32_005230 [Trebouxia sp. C0010 RCD-2024]
MASCLRPVAVPPAARQGVLYRGPVYSFRPKTSRCRVVHNRILTQAKQNDDQGNFQIPAILRLANGVTNSAASLVPATVPRPVAKLGVVGVCGIIALWLFGKVVSTLFTLAAVGGAIFLFVKSKGSTETTDNSNDAAADDPLASARRILDKYK